MPVWLMLCILSAPQAASIDAPPPVEAVDVYQCNFGPEADKNFDGWPDGWSRRRGSGYPLFLPVTIVNEAAEQAAPSALKMSLDGGAAAIYSPQIPVSPLFSYRVEGLIKTEALKHDVAYYSLMFFDADGRLLEAHESAQVHDATAWTQARIGPIAAANPDTYTAVIGLHLRPREGQPDLHGAALFDQVRLSRLPRVALRCNQKLHLCGSLDDVEITCDVSGVLKADPLVTFTLEDVDGNEIAKHETPLATMASVSSHTPMPAKASAEHGKPGPHKTEAKHEHVPADDPAQVRGFAGRASWKPPIKDYGFYRVRVMLADTDATRIERTATLAILRPLTPARHGEFGWSLPQGDQQLSLQELAGVVGQVGIHWLKLPMWYGEEELTRPDRLAWFAERVSAYNVNVIGVLDQPPANVRKTFGGATQLPVATLFVEAPLWQPAVDPVMTRLSLKVRWWQLGGDDDTSFVGFPRLPAKVDEIKQHFLKYGQEVQVGLAWPWLSEPVDGTGDFLSRTTSPTLTAAEITAYLQDKRKGPGARWLVMQPLSPKHYDLETRTRDLVERMLAAKIHRADATFIADPFDPHHGLLNNDGTPAEMLLPWRTTATLLGGAHYLGTLYLPNGSTNHLFRRGNEAMMVVWNRRPTRETLYLGDRIEHFDTWGRTLPHQTVDQDGAVAQSIEVGALPTFVTGLSLPVALWRIHLAFDTPNLTSVFGQDQIARYTFRNTFTQGVGGEVRITPPQDWEIVPLAQSFRAAELEDVHELFQVRFKAEAQSGPQMLKLDFKLTGDRDYAFSAYQPVNVGIGDVSVETITRLNDAGELVVEQTLINQTDSFVSFNCLLFAPGRRRERVQVFDLGRGRHTASYVLERGEELIGQTMLLRAEEMDGNRVLNYRVVPQD
jgi:hypothetical protein